MSFFLATGQDLLEPIMYVYGKQGRGTRMGTSLHIVTGQVAGSNLRQAPVKPIIRARSARQNFGLYMVCRLATLY